MRRKAPPAERLAVNINEFCQLVGISRSTFYAMPADRRPVMISLGGKRWLISKAAITDWLSGKLANA
jgi:excisionase family DNA binding protein